jgi:stage V sporulation protein G
MKITEVRVKLIENKDERLKAFCSMTFDGEFVVRDIKVIAGAGGHFVAMPSRKMSDHCEKCGAKNHLRARFCNDCGSRLPADRIKKDAHGRTKLHADIAHPVNAACRQMIQQRIVAAFEEEIQKSQQPDYQPAVMDEPDDDDIPETSN